jgi:hypothetical protein
MNFNNNSSVDDYPSHYSPYYTPRRRPHYVDDYAARYTPKSREYSSNADDLVSASTTDVSLSINYIPSKFSEFRKKKRREIR